MDTIQLFEKYKESRISGRYITNLHIEPILKEFSDCFEVAILGHSVLEKPIYSVQIGTGTTKIFLWSQMHGNESTTTKALIDLMHFLKSDAIEAQQIREKFTLLCIPILNPDGAETYTRVNANAIDLNRDSVALSQPESRLLRNTFENFQPNFCFNLHDQRSIFAAGATRNPATVSFLSPAYNEEREYNSNRLQAAKVIVAMYEELQKWIPNQIGRFDDTFNSNCIGDMFQMLGVPTILFEAGHFPDDYEREETRKYIFLSYLTGLKCINENVVVEGVLDKYLDIPQNKPIFYDFVYRKLKIIDNSLNIITNFAAHYTEKLVGDKIAFEAFFVEVGDSVTNFGHYEYDGQEGEYSDAQGNIPVVNNRANFYINASIPFVNGKKIE